MALFDRLEKDTNSGLNTFERRGILYGHDIDDLVRWFFDAAFKQPRIITHSSGGELRRV